ncbi:uncharacterized protein UV8b_05952 [Ustilaginoidea virens]|uniref:Uncharacterized protein n=1 Tax=Ustilaginoidea virens TaxID=1159556 RepID=A0A8E5HUA6_USTVR|nr:uncharacterized protein UV8b_05952 [Ustilaginoidea virens]QUC21709.1 hypothetical protein UV8b_05952 [Ustilaginoidea virens]
MYISIPCTLAKITFRSPGRAGCDNPPPPFWRTCTPLNRVDLGDSPFTTPTRRRCPHPIDIIPNTRYLSTIPDGQTPQTLGERNSFDTPLSIYTPCDGERPSAFAHSLKKDTRLAFTLLVMEEKKIPAQHLHSLRWKSKRYPLQHLHIYTLLVMGKKKKKRYPAFIDTPCDGTRKKHRIDISLLTESIYDFSETDMASGFTGSIGVCTARLVEHGMELGRLGLGCGDAFA